MSLFLALLPLLMILVLMIGLHWGGARAGAAGWLTTLVIAAVFFQAGLDVLGWAQIRAFFLALYVLYIIWGALLFYRVTEATGAIDATTHLIQRLSSNKAFQALLLGWPFASFLQGVGGFGVPVAVVAPLLVSLNFTPVDAVVIPSIGHAWAISFGSLGSSFFALVAATGLERPYLAPWMAIALGFVCLLSGPIVLWAAGGKETLKESWLPTLLIAITMAGTQLIAVFFELWNIAAMLGAIAGLIVGSIYSLKQRSSAHSPGDSSQTSLEAIQPYLFLLIIIFATKAIQPLGDLLDILQISFPIPEVVTGQGWRVPAGTTRALSIFGHPGALLVYASFLTLILAKRQGKLDSGATKQIRQKVLKGGVKSTLGILTMVALATTMDNAGMVNLLATKMADFTGSLYPLISPFIGALGAFMTAATQILM